MHSSVEGRRFEKFLVIAAKRDGWRTIQLPAGARFVGRGKVIPVKGPFDFIFQKDGQVIFCDAKSRDDVVLPYSTVNQDQVFELLKLSPFTSGYIVHFRPLNQVGFISAKQLAGLSPHSSIKYTETVPMGFGASFSFGRLFENKGSEN